MKLCMKLNPQFGIPLTEQVLVMKRTGFSGFFANWPTDVPALRRAADETGMEFIAIHAPFGGAADLWQSGPERVEEVVRELHACLEDCAANAVPLMICHAYIGYDARPITPQGMNNYERVVERARQLGVRIAFENTEGAEYLAALLERYRQDPMVGFCWDTGHELCFNKGEDMMALHGQQLLVTHLNDNPGNQDLHLLPFDGAVDWAGVALRLDKAGFAGPMTFELNQRSHPHQAPNTRYAALTGEEFIAEAHRRALRVAALRKNNFFQKILKNKKEFP